MGNTRARSDPQRPGSMRRSNGLHRYVPQCCRIATQLRVRTGAPLLDLQIRGCGNFAQPSCAKHFPAASCAALARSRSGGIKLIAICGMGSDCGAGDTKERASARGRLGTGQFDETPPPRAVCRGLLFQVRIVIVCLPHARQPVTEHHFGDVWLGQCRKVGTRSLA